MIHIQEEQSYFTLHFSSQQFSQLCFTSSQNKRNKNYVNNNQKMEATQLAINGWMDKQKCGMYM